jgi:hypothetical protein
MDQILGGAGQQIIHADNFTSQGQQAVAQMTSQESGATSNEDTFHRAARCHWLKSPSRARTTARCYEAGKPGLSSNAKATLGPLAL